MFYFVFCGGKKNALQGREPRGYEGLAKPGEIDDERGMAIVR